MGFNPQTLDTRAASDEGVWLTLKDVEGHDIDVDGKPVQLRLAGRDSAVAKEAFKDIETKKGSPEAMRRAVAPLVKGWSGNITGDDGKPLPFTPDNVLSIVEIPHIGDWVMEEIINRANFTTKPRSK